MYGYYYVGITQARLSEIYGKSKSTIIKISKLETQLLWIFKLLHVKQVKLIENEDVEKMEEQPVIADIDRFIRFKKSNLFIWTIF